MGVCVCGRGGRESVCVAGPGLFLVIRFPGVFYCVEVLFLAETHGSTIPVR